MHTDTPREMLHRSIRLTAQADALPVDWLALCAALRQIDDGATEQQERAAVADACARAGLPPAEAPAVQWLLEDLSEARMDLEGLPPGELAGLLRELIADGDEAELSAALGVTPYDSAAYVDRLRDMANAAGPDTPADAAAVRAEQIRALVASPKPGHVITEELAGAIVGAVEAWHRLRTETPAQRATREAFAEARRLVDTLGHDDPRAFAAIIRAIELDDPGCCDRMLKEGGITLPAPTRCAEDGEPLYSLEAVADAMGADVADLLAIAEDMEAAGLPVRRQPAGAIH